MNQRELTTTICKLATKTPVTLSIALAAFAVAWFPSAGEALQFDRAKIAAGEVWRLASGHITHWNAEHIQWDLLMFVVLGAACEMRNPRRMWLCVVAAAASVSLLVYCLFSNVEAYRGLSGIDTALFTLLAVDLLRDALDQRRGVLALATGGLLIGFIAKTGFEAITGHAFFVDQQAAGFEMLVWDHIVAAVVGVGVAFGSSPSLPRVREWSPIADPIS